MNFNAGPACMPLPVLEEAKAEFLDFAGTGMSLLEMSHRSAEYEVVHNEAVALAKEMLGLDAEDQVLFLQGGASLQFIMVPMNLLGPDDVADYLITGHWSKAALKEAKIVARPNVACTTEVDGRFVRIPRQEEIAFTPGARYTHITSNNTIFGTQWMEFPKCPTPMVADMSSDMFWRPFDARPFGMIYAGAQKNLGPAGITLVIIKKEMIERFRPGLPTMLSYGTHIKNNSLFNTPTTFAIYLVGKTLKWIKGQGGLPAIEANNRKKGDLVYRTLDELAGFYRAPVEKGSRSYMNIVFRLPSEELEKRFLGEAKARRMIGLKGHRSVGGIRISAYNACEYAWIEAVVALMREFAAKNG
jgi:phosphoserine aminotransferase